MDLNKCDFCSKTFSWPDSLKRHIKNKHPQQQQQQQHQHQQPQQQHQQQQHYHQQQRLKSNIISKCILLPPPPSHHNYPCQQCSTEIPSVSNIGATLDHHSAQLFQPEQTCPVKNARVCSDGFVIVYVLYVLNVIKGGSRNF